MRRVLVIPAAGRGSRLGADGPKVLYPIAGRPLLGHLLARYAPYVDRVVIVTAPDTRASVEHYLQAARLEALCAVQATPTGMLPAILSARALVQGLSPAEVWVTWCDQIAISDETLAHLARDMAAFPDAALVFPTLRQTPPYIHFQRDDRGAIIGVLQRREGDVMPEAGESDAGLFALRRDVYLESLPEYDARAAAGRGTGERNFLPFIPWLAARAPVRTFPVRFPEEAIGVNTPEDVRRLETYLRAHG
jgi:bifunctional N-acetylglucosamine-1-phosphate-uridyltransferase/glucosamine-1-phosphate-acetyltransferase GlmU-like protein